MTAKRYLQIFFTILLLFILFHFTIWHLYTKQLFQNNDNTHVGDLGRMSYHNDSLIFKENRVNLPKKHIDFTKIEKVDVITIGDSFSNGGAGGLNPFYQDYIASFYNFKVLNLEPSKEGWVESILRLNSSGILDKLHPKVIILESIERGCVDRLSKKIDWNLTADEKTVIQDMKKRYPTQKEKTSFINNLNYNALIYNLLYKFNDHAYSSKVYIAPISKQLFSSQNPKELLFYFEDIKNLKKSNQKSIALLNENLNHLQEILKKKNIHLYFMPTPDKYDIYSKYIINNQYEQSHFFELLRGLKKEYTFIDTKAIIKQLIDDNEKDVYYPDDTHWSYKASAKIFEETKFN